MDRATLDRALLQAHEQADSIALVQLYSLAADQQETAGHVDAACFYLTHAFVFALEAGLPEAAVLNRRLAAHGRVDLLPEDTRPG
ncbi:hypothetical protein ACFSUD_13725 [Sulfitobacter aestuarii]|uniref:Uncharacterized protein n=1 Tax=Sulfitobacter aestuarii TaxID=2161676 RepID=A0ABW5U419_9RHOB